MDLIRI